MLCVLGTLGMGQTRGTRACNIDEHYLYPILQVYGSVLTSCSVDPPSCRWPPGRLRVQHERLEDESIDGFQFRPGACLAIPEALSAYNKTCMR